MASRRTAVGLAGVAPRLVPSRGRAALMPDASVSLAAWALRLPLQMLRVEGGLLFPSPYHAAHVVKVCAQWMGPLRLRPCGRLRTLTTTLRRAGAGLGQSRPILGADHVAPSLFFRFFPSRSQCRGRLPSGPCRRGAAGRAQGTQQYFLQKGANEILLVQTDLITRPRERRREQQPVTARDGLESMTPNYSRRSEHDDVVAVWGFW